MVAGRYSGLQREGASVVLVCIAAETGECERTSVDIIVGLGNPGPRYAHTRHNIGFDVIDVLARRCGISMQPLATKALCGQGKIGGRAVFLVKPQTYMNASGQAVAPIVRKHLGSGDRLVVVHDEIDLSLGRIKIKRQGGDAGHLGIRSIIECLGHGDFLRIRMGVGRPACKSHIVEYVLSSFTAAEKETCEEMIAQAVKCIETLLQSPS